MAICPTQILLTFLLGSSVPRVCRPGISNKTKASIVQVGNGAINPCSISCMTSFFGQFPIVSPSSARGRTLRRSGVSCRPGLDMFPFDPDIYVYVVTRLVILIITTTTVRILNTAVTVRRVTNNNDQWS